MTKLERLTKAALIRMYRKCDIERAKERQAGCNLFEKLKETESLLEFYKGESAETATLREYLQVTNKKLDSEIAECDRRTKQVDVLYSSLSSLRTKLADIRTVINAGLAVLYGEDINDEDPDSTNSAGRLLRHIYEMTQDEIPKDNV